MQAAHVQEKRLLGATCWGGHCQMMLGSSLAAGWAGTGLWQALLPIPSLGKQDHWLLHRQP